MSTQLNALFGELDRHCKAGVADSEKITKTADKILKLSPNDPDALHCKFVALISDENYAAALDTLSVIKKSNKSLANELVFENAYLLYQLHRLKEALDLIEGGFKALVDVEDNEAVLGAKKKQLKLLQVQILYRMEKYDECLVIYERLLDETKKDDSFYTELVVNYNAVKAAAYAVSTSQLEVKSFDDSIDTYEMAYNLACVNIASGRLPEAIKLLEKARKKCRDALVEEEYAEEEIEQELAVIVVQLGYVFQLQGRESEALELYQGVLKSRVGDIIISAVASNNINSLKKEKDLFDSAKRHKVASATPGLETKLTKLQQKIIAMNGAILLLYMKQ
ncbi:Signal recognition particle core component, partial [Nowakowskiella sp. JEL0078]